MAQSPACKIHVLLVDHDTTHHAPTIDMLEYFSYKVTTVKLASTASSILSKAKSTFDLLMQNVNSPDACGFKLLQDAVQMELPVIYDDDVVLTRRALESGVLLCIKKPISMEIAMYLWQHVLREKICRLKENERLRELTAYNRLQSGLENEENYTSKKKVRCLNRDEENSVPHHGVTKFKRKVWTEWTQELHEKFMDAVRKLGEGRCYPKEILELMNVPGLTRMQVASHLQKCRRGTWQPPIDRKSKLGIPKTRSLETSNRAKPKRFGYMPLVGSNSQENRENSQDRDPIKYSSMGNIVLGENREWSSHDSNYYNLFSHVGIETLNMGHLGLTLGMDDAFISEEQFVYDAQSVASSTNASLDQRNTTDQDNNYEFSNIGSLIQNPSASQQEPRMNSSGSQQALDLLPVRSNLQMPVMHHTIVDQRDELSKSDSDKET